MNAKRKSIRLIGCRHKSNTFTIMKKYVKAQMVAKNLASGSYAAGCPAEERGSSSYGKYSCINCERTK